VSVFLLSPPPFHSFIFSLSYWSQATIKQWKKNSGHISCLNGDQVRTLIRADRKEIKSLGVIPNNRQYIECFLSQIWRPKGKTELPLKLDIINFIVWRFYSCWPSIARHFNEFFLFGATASQWARTSSFTRFLDHTQRRTTVGRTPLDEWSARRRDLYLTTHNTHNRLTSMPPVGFEHKISTGERSQNYALDRAATGTGKGSLQNVNKYIILLCVMSRKNSLSVK